MTRATCIRWSRNFLGWTLIGLFFGSQLELASALGFGMRMTWYQAFASGLADWYIWGALAPLIFWSGRRFRLDSGPWPARLLLHMVASVCVSLVQLLLTTGIAQLLSSLAGRPFPFLMGLQFALVVKFHWNVVIYWAVLGFSHALSYYRESRQRALEAVQLESQLAQARLESLKRQLNPHFLFNALNTISQFIFESPEKADGMLTNLGELLRLSLDVGGEHRVALRQELEFLERYLDIQKARFGDRLTTKLDIDEGLCDALVPTLILQPLVENAVRHGLSPRSTPGHIEIEAQVHGSTLCLRVSDNGAGLAESESALREGVGLGNTRARLRQLYGADQSLTCTARPGGGVVSALTLPLQRLTKPVDESRRAAIPNAAP